MGADRVDQRVGRERDHRPAAGPGVGAPIRQRALDAGRSRVARGRLGHTVAVLIGLDQRQREVLPRLGRERRCLGLGPGEERVEGLDGGGHVAGAPVAPGNLVRDDRRVRRHVRHVLIRRDRRGQVAVQERLLAEPEPALTGQRRTGRRGQGLVGIAGARAVARQLAGVAELIEDEIAVGIRWEAIARVAQRRLGGRRDRRNRVGVGVERALGAVEFQRAQPQERVGREPRIVRMGIDERPQLLRRVGGRHVHHGLPPDHDHRRGARLRPCARRRRRRDDHRRAGRTAAWRGRRARRARTGQPDREGDAGDARHAPSLTRAHRPRRTAAPGLVPPRRPCVDGEMRQLIAVVSLALSLTLAACGGKSTPAPAAPAEPTPAEPAPADPELVCCTIASSGDMMSGMTPIEDCPEENRTPDACGAE
jgi:hypothetical protein